MFLICYVFSSAVGVKLDDNLTGLLVFKGERGFSSLSTILQYQAEKLSLSLGVQLGIPDTNVNFNYSRSVIDDSLRLKFAARFVMNVLQIATSLL